MGYTGVHRKVVTESRSNDKQEIVVKCMVKAEK